MANAVKTGETCSTEKKEKFFCNQCGKEFLLPVRDDVPWEDLALLGVVGFISHTECPECGGYMSKNMSSKLTEY